MDNNLLEKLIRLFRTESRSESRMCEHLSYLIPNYRTQKIALHGYSNAYKTWN